MGLLDWMRVFLKGKADRGINISTSIDLGQKGQAHDPGEKHCVESGCGLPRKDHDKATHIFREFK